MYIIFKLTLFLPKWLFLLYFIIIIITIIIVIIIIIIRIINIFFKKLYGWCVALSLLTACPKNQLYRCNQIPC